MPSKKTSARVAPKNGAAQKPTSPLKGTALPAGDLKRGSKGAPVGQLQSALVKLGHMTQAQVSTGPNTFGPQTEAAVKKFQAKHGVPVTGYYGPKTRAAFAKLGAKIAIHDKVDGGGSTVMGYVKGVARRIKVSSVGGGKVMRIDAAGAYKRMAAAAKSAGITLRVNSAFRSMAAQQRLYKLYKSGKGNLAARPGYSNHQGGIAVDIEVGSTASPTYKWLARNAAKHGFRRTVPSEPWHWEYRA
jgi:hypothetical protein